MRGDFYYFSSLAFMHSAALLPSLFSIGLSGGRFCYLQALISMQILRALSPSGGLLGGVKRENT